MNRSALIPSPHRTLQWFSFHQALKSAIIVKIFAGGMLAIQGIAYQKAYSSVKLQKKTSASLASALGLGFICSDPANLRFGTQGYMVYRELGFMSVIVATWAILTMVKALRGAEEDEQ